jgi:hypothetical protein
MSRAHAKPTAMPSERTIILGKQGVCGVLGCALGAFVLTAGWAYERYEYSDPWRAWYEAFKTSIQVLLYGSWFFVPLGIALGIALPRVVRRFAPLTALSVAALLGASTGAVLAACIGGWSGQFTRIAATMVPFWSFWLGAWAWFLVGRKRHELPITVC